MIAFNDIKLCMRITLLTLLFAFISFPALSQGTINFANAGGGAAGSVNAPVTNYIWPSLIGYRVEGPDWVAQLYWGGAGVSDSSSLVALQGSALAVFNTGAQAGYFTGGQRTFPVPGGTVVSLQVRVWNLASGSTYEEAQASLNPLFGRSNIIQYTLGTPPATPNNMVGLQSILIIPIPEPTGATILISGCAVALLGWRRR